MSQKNYYIMLANPPAEGPVANSVKQPSVYTNRGEMIGEIEGEFEFTLDLANGVDARKFPPLDIEETGQHLLYSKKMIDVFNVCGVENIEYFQATVTYTPTGEKYDYQVANIIGKRAGLNMDKSVYEIDDDDDDDDPIIFGIEKIVFDEDKFQDQKIFRLKEKSILMVVHVDIKIALEDAGLTGLMFVKDEEWKLGMI